MPLLEDKKKKPPVKNVTENLGLDTTSSTYAPIRTQGGVPSPMGLAALPKIPQLAEIGMDRYRQEQGGELMPNANKRKKPRMGYGGPGGV